jgi:DNA recombination protein Rad52
MNGLSTEQTKALEAKLQAKNIREREIRGTSFSYLEGWHVIAEANRIFGFDGWDRETLESACVWHATGRDPACSYTARVRIRVRAGDKLVIRDGSGFGSGTGITLGEAHEKALKEAETDATKRAFMTFGNPFGLALYDKDQTQVTGRKPQKHKWPLVAGTGLQIKDYRNPHLFYGGAKKLLQEAQTVDEVRRLWEANELTFRRLREVFPDMRDENGTHFTILFCRACRTRLQEIAAVPTANQDSKPRTPPPSQPRASGNAEPVEASEHVADVAPAAFYAISGQAAAQASPERQDQSALVQQEPPPPQGAQAEHNSVKDSSRPISQPTDLVDPLTATLVALKAPMIPSSHQGSQSIDLPFGKIQRHRDREHLKRVAAQPCLVCGRNPAQAHHLTFAQPRARSLKVSDEWTVPLCALHHRALHDHGNELTWWQTKGIEPIGIAQALWAARRDVGGAASLEGQHDAG